MATATGSSSEAALFAIFCAASFLVFVFSGKLAIKRKDLPGFVCTVSLWARAAPVLVGNAKLVWAWLLNPALGNDLPCRGKHGSGTPSKWQ